MFGLGKQVKALVCYLTHCTKGDGLWVNTFRLEHVRRPKKTRIYSMVKRKLLKVQQELGHGVCV